MNTTLSYMLRSWFFISLTLLAACNSGASNTSSNDTSQPLMTLTGALAAVSEQLSGTYAVYSEAGTLLLNGDLLLSDDGTGGVVVSAPAMTLERNTIYRFVIVYFWDGVAIAYVDSTQTTENADATTITFTADSLEYAVLTGLSASESAAFAASVSAGTLPDLDLDDDGFSNFIELRSGTDPNDASSVPTGPTMTDFAAAISADGNTLTITATITDGHGVSAVALSFPNTSYLSNVLTTTISGADGDISRTLSATFNPQYAPLGALDIQLSASDALELEKTETLTTTITHNGTNVGPVLDFESPSVTGAVLSGTTTLSVRAYDATHGVQSLTLTQPANLTDLSTSTDLFTAAWNTATIVDNTTTTLTASAVDGLGATTTKSLTVTISNGTDLSGPTITLTVDEQAYASLSTLSGTIEVRAAATDATGVSSLSLYNESSLDGLTVIEGLPTSYRSTIDTTQYTNGETITLNFVAFDTHGYQSTTSFTLTVNNDLDGDGSLIGTDCDDGNPLIYPGAPELLDGILNDCDGAVDSIGLAFADAKFFGEAASDYAGRSVVNVGDIDADGKEDLMIGLGYNLASAIAGKAYLIYGRDSISSFSLENADAVFIGENLGDYVGDHIASVGDVNADGFGDIIIGSHTNDESGTDSGKTYLIYGSAAHFSGEINLSQVGLTSGIAGATFLGENAGDYSGVSVVGAGDVNGDTYDDILIGAYGYDNYNGKVYLIYGSATLLGSYNLSAADASFTGETTSYAGAKMSKVGDVNHDGYDDLLIGAYYYADQSGRTYLIFGGTGLTDSLYLDQVGLTSGIAGATFTGETGDFSSLGIAGLGDTDGDGKADFTINAGHFSNNLRMHIISGATVTNGQYRLSDVGEIITHISTEISSDEYNFYGAGDVNDDGYNDFLFGVITMDSSGSDSGETYLFYGPITSQSTSSADAIFSGEAAGDFSGYANALIDFNGDGFSDIVIGSMYQDAGGTDAGAAYLILSQF